MQMNTDTSHAQQRTQLLTLAAATDGGVAGRKAATLARLCAHQRVPDGFVIPEPVCASLAGVVPVALRGEIAEALRALGGGPVAVRSSALAEDGAEASFAGQLYTALDVHGVDAVCDAAIACIASATEARARVYRNALAADAALGVAVLVQRMVPATTAGVAFSVNPSSGDDEVLVSAVAGLGDKLVSGEVTPEDWTLVDGRVLQAPADSRVIDEALARRIAALVCELAATADEPQDVEWAVADGELYLLQSRPITAVPVKPSFDDPSHGTWTRDEVHYPTAMTAFGASTYLPILARALGAMAQEFGLMIDGLEQHWRSGDVYGRVIAPGGKEGPAPPWWLLAMLARVVPSIRARMRAANHALTSGLFDDLVDDWNGGGRERFEASVRELASVDLAALAGPAQLEHLDRVLALLERGQLMHFRLFMPWLLTTHRFVTAAAELLDYDDRKALALLVGHSRTSSAPTRELRALAIDIKACDGGAAAVQAHDPLLALRGVDADLADRTLDWIERWGLRACNYDTGAPTLAEQPGLLVGLLREAVVNHDHVAPAVTTAELPELSQLPRVERERLERTLARAREVYPLREDNVLYTDNLVCGLARRAALAIGRTLVARRELSRADDAAELRIDELRAAVRGERNELSSLARRRRRERAWVAAHPGPSLLCGTVHPPPDMRGLPAGGRAINEAFMWALELEYPQMTTPAAQASPDEESSSEGLRGLGAWPGRHLGTVRVVTRDTDLAQVRAGDVLVASVTAPAWSIVFARIGALVTDRGGVLSHAAIVAREHGIPTVLNTGDATTRLKSGQRVLVDGAAGTVVPQ